MAKNCPSCGGNLEQKETGYKCRSCGKMFDAADLAESKKKQEIYTTQFSSDCGVDVFSDNINGVLEITWSDGEYRHSGSGFLITRDGYAITNTHVVTTESGRSCKTVNIKLCNENITADVVRLGDDKHGNGKGVDLALIKLNRVPQNAKALRLENFNNVRIGERVFVIGNSLGYGTCMTSGIVSDKTRNVNGKILLMTDCAINGGNSGGPIFNDNGLVIGAVVSGITSAEGMNFAIPSNIIRRFIESASGIRLMQQVPDRNDREDPDVIHFAAPYTGVYTGQPGCSIPPPVGSKPGGRFEGLGVEPSKPSKPGGAFEGLKYPSKKSAPCPECPQCKGTNVQLTEGGFYWCGDCYCEW